MFHATSIVIGVCCLLGMLAAALPVTTAPRASVEVPTHVNEELTKIWDSAPALLPAVVDELSDAVNSQLNAGSVTQLVSPTGTILKAPEYERIVAQTERMETSIVGGALEPLKLESAAYLELQGLGEKVTNGEAAWILLDQRAQREEREMMETLSKNDIPTLVTDVGVFASADKTLSTRVARMKKTRPVEQFRQLEMESHLAEEAFEQAKTRQSSRTILKNLESMAESKHSELETEMREDIEIKTFTAVERELTRTSSRLVAAEEVVKAKITALKIASQLFVSRSAVET